LIGVVLSGGGGRAGYQVGVLKALAPYLTDKHHKIKVIVGSSVGALNGLVLAACLNEGLETAIERMESLWITREFRNTFHGHPSKTFIKTLKVAIMQNLAPGPASTSDAVFNPTPLMQEIDRILKEGGGLRPENRHPDLDAVAVMTTVEGDERKPLLFVSSKKPVSPSLLEGATYAVSQVETLSVKHGFGSAALPSILPPVEMDTDHGRVTLVDGGISQNIPVDPAIRLGAKNILIVDISGRNYWLEKFGHPPDKRPSWEIPAGLKTYSMHSPHTFTMRNDMPLGLILKEAVSHSRKKFISSVGPAWPVFTLMKKKFGEEVAFETMSYVALDSDYEKMLIEQGFNDTKAILQEKGLNFKAPKFSLFERVHAWVSGVLGD